MPFLLMLFLTLACLPEAWPRPGAWVGSPLRSVLFTWLGVLLEIGLAFAVARRVRRSLQTLTEPREPVLTRYRRGRLVHLLGLFATYGLALYAFGYGWAVQELWVWHARPLPAGEVLLLAPFCVALVLSWACFYDAER